MRPGGEIHVGEKDSIKTLREGISSGPSQLYLVIYITLGGGGQSLKARGGTEGSRRPLCKGGKIWSSKKIPGEGQRGKRKFNVTLGRGVLEMEK